MTEHAPSMKILVALDGSAGAWKALRFGVRLAASHDGHSRTMRHRPHPYPPMNAGEDVTGGGNVPPATAGTPAALAPGVELHSISIIEIGRHSGALLPMSDEREWADSPFAEVIRRAQAEARKAGIELHPHVAVGHEVKWISEFAGEQGFDMLVVGFAGHSELDGAMGGTCYGLVQHAPCAVLVAKS